MLGGGGGTDIEYYSMSVVGWDGRGARAYDLCVCVRERERVSQWKGGNQYYTEHCLALMSLFPLYTNTLPHPLCMRVSHKKMSILYQA